MRVYVHDGSELTLGKVIGRGGEGNVYEVLGREQFVAKLYHHVVSPTKAEKLYAMVNSADGNLLRVAAWPTGVLHEKRNGKVIGLLMPRITNYTEIHQLYGPKYREQYFPKADWCFLIMAARNVAAAFSTVHGKGHVIGDVNQGNVVAAGNSLIKLIDCDSFQIRAAGKIFLCEVGVALFTPPELQGKNYSSVARTQNHDAFGLAVLLFHLLFLGRHPFAGRYGDGLEVPLEHAIKEFRFTFSSSAAARRMTPPPHSLPLSSASFTVASLFERAFAQSGMNAGRPTAEDWVFALDKLRSELKTCGLSNAHKYHTSLSECPWCQIERGGGPDFFAGIRIAIPGGAIVDLTQLWAALGAIPNVPNFGIPPAIPRITTSRTLAVKARSAFVKNAPVLAFIGLVWTLLGYGGLGFILSLLSFIGWTILARSETFVAERKRISADLAKARAERTAATMRWEREPRDLATEFLRRKTELESLGTEYQAIPERQRADLAALQSNKRLAQLNRHLRSHFVEKANLSGLGPSRISVLRSYGIETAADVNVSTIRRIPGFGPTRTQTLTTWRRRIESSFVFDPSKSVDRADIDAIVHGYRKRRDEIERRAKSGIPELEAVARRSQALRTQLNTLLTKQATAIAELENGMSIYSLRPHGAALVVAGIVMLLLLVGQPERPAASIIPPFVTDTAMPRTAEESSSRQVVESTIVGTESPRTPEIQCRNEEVCLYAEAGSNRIGGVVSAGDSVQSWHSSANSRYWVRMRTGVEGFVTARGLAALILPDSQEPDSGA